jgi:tRNA(Ile)-lysidine synthase
MLDKQAFQHQFSVTNDSTLAVALSGGGDSTALLYWLYQNFATQNIHAVHFNHGLRKESDAEQRKLVKLCDTLGVAFHTEKWQQKPDGNLQQEARKARYTFFAQLCKEQSFPCIYTGHNQDDIAENVLMRLARGSGLKGLAAIESITEIEGVSVCRPLLYCTREEIRGYLMHHNVTWLEDPSNDDEAFFRVRVRKHKKALEDIGISFESIVASSRSLQRAEHLVEKIATAYYAKNVSLQGRVVTLPESLLQEEEELVLRVLDKAITHYTNRKIAVRATKKQRLAEHLQVSEKRYELAGVAFYKKEQKIFVEKS